MVMKPKTWMALNEIDESLYEARALLNVMSDGMCNEITTLDHDTYATTTRLVCQRIEKAQEINNQLFAIYREEKDEYIKDEWKDWEKLASKWPDDGEVELAFQDSGRAEDSGEVDERKSSTSHTKFASVSLDLIEEHPDGSATFKISGDKENIEALMSAAFCSLIVRGIAHMEEETIAASEKMRSMDKVLFAAKQLSDILIQWETDEDLDYDPHVVVFRKALTELL
jgi:hypothetical protein